MTVFIVKCSYTVDLWELCSKFPSLFYSKFLSKSLHYAQFYSFYAAPSITIPLKLPIKVSYLSYLTLVEPLKSTHLSHFTFINTFIVCPEP